jgi:Flp pilus assembly protein TadD
MPVQWWPLRSRHVRALELYRVAGTTYAPTRFERAIAELYDGRPNEALAEVEEHRRSGGTMGPDYLAAEARAYILLGDLSRGRELLSAALALQPANPDLQFQLGNVLAGLGEDALAREAWKRARKLDPYDDRVVDALRWLDGQGDEAAGP